MASYTAEKAVHKTLSTTTVDTVTIQGGWPKIEVLNRGTSGDLSVVHANGSTPDNPTALADDTEVVPAGGSLELEVHPADGDTVLKIIGNGQAYSVTGIDA